MKKSKGKCLPCQNSKAAVMSNHHPADAPTPLRTNSKMRRIKELNATKNYSDSQGKLPTSVQEPNSNIAVTMLESLRKAASSDSSKKSSSSKQHTSRTKHSHGHQLSRGNSKSPPSSSSDASVSSTGNTRKKSLFTSNEKRESLSIQSRQTLFSYTEEEKDIIQRLVKRKYHLPGNSYWRDFKDYLVNNHHVLCFCFRHPLHPLRGTDRIFILIGSLSFGAFVTNAVVVLYLLYDIDLNEILYNLYGFDITKGMVSLWISGGLIHSIFDCLVWYIAACPCVQPGGVVDRCSKRLASCCLYLGRNLVSSITLICILIATGTIAIRSSMVEKTATEIPSLLLLYTIEVVVSLFIYNPLMKLIMFSGVLGCFRIPILGGRPYEIRQENSIEDNDMSDYHFVDNV